MKTKLLVTLALATLVPSLAHAAKPAHKAPTKGETYMVSPADSKVTWEGKKKIGGAHHGTVNVKSGRLLVKDGKLTGGDFEMDMTSLKVIDVPDDAMNKKLTGHLRSDDFFSVDKHPTAILKITKTEEKGGKTLITGDLTIKGKTAPVTFPAAVTVSPAEVKAQSKVTVDRTKYDVRYNSGKYFPNLGDKVINDEFTVEVDLTAKK